MKKSIINSIISILLSATLFLACPASGSISYAAMDDDSAVAEVVMDQEESSETESPAAVSGEPEQQNQEDVNEGAESEITEGAEETEETVQTYTTVSNTKAVTYAASSVTINATNFPDANFRQYVKDEIDTDGNGVLSSSEIGACTYINCSFPMEISSLKGIEIFYNLEELYCSENELSSLDVSGCTSLTYLDCWYNNLSSLSVSGCTKLSYLNCNDNNLSSLDVSGCASLTDLSCWDNNLSRLDVSGCASLTDLSCRDNNLSSLDVSGCTKLTELDCSNNNLNSLDVSGCTSLESLSDVFDENNLTMLNASGCTSLLELDCSNQNLSSLNVSGCTKLTELDCNNNKLNILDVSGCTELTSLWCYDNNLSRLDASGCTSLLELDCSNQNLSSLNVSGCTKLTTLWCYDNNLSRLDVSGCTKLTFLFCDSNNLSSLDVSENTELYRLYCYNNNLSSLDVSKNTALYDLECYNNNLSSLDVSKNTALYDLECYNNNLSRLNVSGCTELTYLDCSCNSLSSLKIDKNTKLKELDCDRNNLNSLDISKNTALESLYGWGNNIESLNVSKNKELTKVVLINTPKINSLTKVTSGVSISWSKSIGATGYYIYRRVKDGSWEKIADVKDESTLSYTDKTVSDGKTYEYRICGYYTTVSSNEMGTIEYGETYIGNYDQTVKSITIPSSTLATPKISGVSNVSGGVKISWGKVTGAAKYRVSYKTGSGSWTKIADTTSTSYTWKGAKSGTKYTFTVRCVSSDGKSFTSSYNKTGKSITYIAAPELSGVSNVSGGIKISWGKVAGAAKYRVYYETEPGSWTKIADTTSTSYTWKGAKSGTNYTFTVRCVSSDEKNCTSDYDRTGKSITYTSGQLATPKLTAVSNEAGGVKLTWGKVTGAAKYRIYYKTGSGSWTKIGDTTSTSYTWKEAKSGTKYTFTVRCVSSDGKSCTSDYDRTGKSITYTSGQLATPKLTAASNEAGGVKLTWGKVTGAAKYRIYYKTGSGSWTKIGDTTSTSYTWKGAKSGTNYTFTVRCVSSDGKSCTSDYDRTGKSITYTSGQLATPKLTAVSNEAGGVKLTWGKVTGAAKYRIYYKTGSGSWTKIGDTTATSYTWKEAKSGTKYTFTIRCVSSDGKSCTSDYDRKGKSITYIAAPKLSGVSNVNGGIKISWGKVTGAAKYRIYYKTGSGSWTKIGDTTSTSYTWKEAKSGTKYTFTIRCVSSDGKSCTSGYDATGKAITFVK